MEGLLSTNSSKHSTHGGLVSGSLSSNMHIEVPYAYHDLLFDDVWCSNGCQCTTIKFFVLA